MRTKKIYKSDKSSAANARRYSLKKNVYLYDDNVSVVNEPVRKQKS